LAKLILDFNSDVSLEEQKEAGMRYLRKHCQGIIETAKVERQVRIEHALEEERLLMKLDLQRKIEELNILESQVSLNHCVPYVIVVI
jgi:hypothetical protein